jgi:competence protein ComEC
MMLRTEYAVIFSVITSLALGWITGTALQLQQGQLWAAEVYWVLGFVALGLAMFLCVSAGALLKAFAWFALTRTLAFSLAGARASHY